jgi:hypothetical protein
LKTEKDKSKELNSMIVNNMKGFVVNLRKLGDSTREQIHALETIALVTSGLGLSIENQKKYSGLSHKCITYGKNLRKEFEGTARTALNALIAKCSTAINDSDTAMDVSNDVVNITDYEIADDDRMMSIDDDNDAIIHNSDANSDDSDECSHDSNFDREFSDSNSESDNKNGGDVDSNFHDGVIDR